MRAFYVSKVLVRRKTLIYEGIQLPPIDFVYLLYVCLFFYLVIRPVTQFTYYLAIYLINYFVLNYVIIHCRITLKLNLSTNPHLIQ